MATATLYDSVTPASIPPSATAAAGYVDGRYAWPIPAFSRFQFTKRITVTGSVPCDVLDIEHGDAEPEDAPGWVARALAAGVKRPTLYVSRLGTWPPTLLVMDGRPVDYWVADYTGVPHLLPGSVATQWIDTGAYDLSIADAAWLGDVAPVPLNAPIVAILPTHTGLGYYLIGADGGVFSKGDAVFHGSAVGDNPGTIVDAALSPSGAGYWLVNTAGAVYSFGDARYEGNAP